MKRTKGVSRRKLLEGGVTAVAAGAAGLLAAPQGGPQQPPAVITRRRCCDWMSRGDAPGRTPLQEVTWRPISGRHVLVRTEATNLCYSNSPAVLGQQQTTGPAAPPSVLAPSGARRMNDLSVIQGHGGIG